MRTDAIRSPARLTTTIYAYLEQLVADVAPGQVWRLGTRWSFGLPVSDHIQQLSEYSLPLNPIPILEVLLSRGGLMVRQHVGEPAQSLYAYLASGEAAIVAIDAFYLPFRPAYRKIHSARTVLARLGGRGQEVLIQDGWNPAAEGTLHLDRLDQARYSTVPLDPLREPLFAGKAIEGEWFSVEVTPVLLHDPAA